MVEPLFTARQVYPDCSVLTYLHVKNITLARAE